MFTLPDEKSVLYIEGDYSISIIILSVFIAIFASYTSLSINERMKYNSFFPRYIWLGLASITMGFGIWSMHFIGMSAHMLPVSMELNSSLTILSILPAVAASFLAFYITSTANTSSLKIVLSGIVMGLGISTMHYTGMLAMEMDVKYAYKLDLFVLSIVIAINGFFCFFIYIFYYPKIYEQFYYQMDDCNYYGDGYI